MTRIALALALLGVIALANAVHTAQSQLPSFDELKSSPNGQMIRVHAADGTVIVSLGPSYGDWLPYNRIPAVMRDAEISAEDRRFFSHPGLDPLAIIRAIAADVRTWTANQGGSTITQQLARNIFLSSQKKFGRKFRESILALAMERKFSKEQILELYLNKVYFGGGSYGIDAAARKFFGHGAEHLSLSEAAVIAGLVKAPSHYSGPAYLNATKGRASAVLKLMQRAGKITAGQADDADIGAVSFTPEQKQNSVRYFTDWALPQLDTLIDEKEKPLEVWTTLDLNMQRAGDTAIKANVPSGAQGALVSLDRDGAVRAMVGGTDYVSSIYNHATQATRQPGSAFELFVYLTAFEAGKKPEDTEVDRPVTIDGWTPRNDSRHNSGTVTLRTAFAYSLNTIAAKLGKQVGYRTVADMARRFGISTPVNTHPSMVLGTSDVRLIDMTRAFASVASKGVAVTPYGITRVTANGEMLYEHSVDQNHVLVAPYVAAEVTDLLQTAVTTGTGRAARIGRPVAGKTGTTTSNADGWSLGFSSGITTGVWIGRDDSRPIPGLRGGTAPAQAWAAYMSKAVASRPVEAFDTAATLPEQQIEPDEEVYGQPGNGAMIDENGDSVQAQTDAPAPSPSPRPLDQDFINRALGRVRRQP